MAEGHLAGLRERHPLVDGAVSRWCAYCTCALMLASRLWAAACSRGTNERSVRSAIRSAIRRAHRQAPQQRVRPRGHSRPPRASRARRIRLLFGVPRGGPSEEVRSPAFRSLFLTTSAVPGAEVVPVARRRKANRVKNGKQGAYARAAAARARALD